MSAFICNDSHISALAHYAYEHGIAAPKSAEQIGKILSRENVRSVNHRYSEKTRNSFKLQPVRHYSHVAIIKAAHCLEYQSCEHDEWLKSEARRILQQIIVNAVAMLNSQLPGYASAAWEIRD